MSKTDQRRKREAIWRRKSSPMVAFMSQFSDDSIRYLEARERGEVFVCEDSAIQRGYRVARYPQGADHE